MEKLLIVGFILFVALPIVFIVPFYNKFITLRNYIKEAFSTMDVYLKKRWDLIPNLVEVVKGYTNHENDTLNEVTALRTGVYDEMTVDKKINVNENLTQRLSQIMAISEGYPELKASENFLQLSKDLSKIEDEIANSRKYYNGTVRILNNKIEMFPSNIIASIFGFKQANMFEANIEEKNNVKVDL